MKAAIPDREPTQPGKSDLAGMEKKAVYLRALAEVAREMGRLNHPRELAEAFLLTIMGTFGIPRGWIGIHKTDTLESVFAVHRGLPETDAARHQQVLPPLAARQVPTHHKPGLGRPRILSTLRGEIGTEPDWAGEGWDILVTWHMGDSHAGILALGHRITGIPFDSEEIEILEHFAGVFIGALSQELSLANILQLNADLERTNMGLRHAAESAERAREDLDRKIYQLKTLSDLTTELSSIIRMEELLQSYLLVSMGAVGCGQACIVLFDRTSETVRTAVRGVTATKPLTGRDTERLLFKCLGSSAKQSLTPMTVSRIDAARIPSGEDLGMALVPSVALLFVVDPSLLGIACFGPKPTGQGGSEEDADLLMALTSNVLAFLKNAQSFLTIEALNEDLAARNEDLTQTIAELREARFTIAILEKAKTHLKSMVLREIDRLGTARPLDFLFMLILAGFLGLLFNYTSPQSLPLLPETWFRAPMPTVGLSEARKLVEEGRALLIDARPKELYDQEHIQGAINVPLALFDLLYMMKIARLPSDTAVIVYGRTMSRHYDEEVAHRLKRRDREYVRVLEGGVRAWAQEGSRSRP